ncbi:MAG: hypothetical protein M1396_03050, partial [Chloroflexi bacterium]|nr:hypothetical protein [Chloroflexota bacterium]
WYGLGALWLVDGLLQAQPAMFTGNFVSQVIKPAIQSAPMVTQPLLQQATELWQHAPVLFNALSIAIQLLIGLLLLTGWHRRWGTWGLWLSIGWGLLVWVGGEGFGGIFSGSASLLTGAPGSVLVYVFGAFLLVLPESRWQEKGFFEKLFRGLGCFWLAAAAYQMLPQQNFWTAKGLQAIFQASASSPQPAILAAPIRALAHAVVQQPVLWNAALVAAMALVGIYFLLGARWRWGVWVVAAILLFSWWMGQDFGALFSGLSTDPNTAAPLLLLTIALLLGRWSLLPSDRQGSGSAFGRERSVLIQLSPQN